MSLPPSAAIATHELRQFVRDPGQIVQMLFTPLVMIAFLTPAFEPVLAGEGFEGASGAAHAVPGMVVMFSFFAAGMVGFTFFREHGYGTWNRLRATPAGTLDIAVGKVVPTFLLVLAQQAALFVVGVVVFRLEIRGSVPGLALVAVSLALSLVALGVLFAAVLRSSEQLQAASSMTAMALAGLGGAFTPLSVLPSWAQAIAPATPTYWAMRGFRSVILEGVGVGAVVAPVAVLLAFAVACTTVATSRFRFDEAKRFAM